MRLLILIFGLFLQNGYSQVSEQNKIGFQVVIFNSENRLVQNDTVGLQLSILQGSMSGTSVFTERHQKVTNVNGLIALEIGNGNVQLGVYDSIEWSSGPYYLKTEADPDGGLNYKTISITQMLSVPYALYAKTVEVERDPSFSKSVASVITASDTTNWNKTLIAGDNISISNDVISAFAEASSSNLYLGQDTLGGVVFYIYYDSLKQAHGLIVNKGQVDSLEWIETNAPFSKMDDSRSWDGAHNTALMTNSPVKDYVDSLNNNNDGGYNDWYLPSLDELKFLWQNRFHVNSKLYKLNAVPLNQNYWSSSEYKLENYAYFFIFYNRGNSSYTLKTNKFSARAIRAF